MVPRDQIVVGLKVRIGQRLVNTVPDGANLDPRIALFMMRRIGLFDQLEFRSSDIYWFGANGEMKVIGLAQFDGIDLCRVRTSNGPVGYVFRAAIEKACEASEGGST